MAWSIVFSNKFDLIDWMSLILVWSKCDRGCKVDKGINTHHADMRCIFYWFLHCIDFHLLKIIVFSASITIVFGIQVLSECNYKWTYIVQRKTYFSHWKLLILLYTHSRMDFANKKKMQKQCLMLYFWFALTMIFDYLPMILLH